jgi:hypothetical protein
MNRREMRQYFVVDLEASVGIRGPVDPSTESMGALNSLSVTVYPGKARTWIGSPDSACGEISPGADRFPAERIVPGKPVVRQNHDGIPDSRAIPGRYPGAPGRTRAVTGFADSWPPHFPRSRTYKLHVPPERASKDRRQHIHPAVGGPHCLAIQPGRMQRETHRRAAH